MGVAVVDGLPGSRAPGHGDQGGGEHVQEVGGAFGVREVGQDLTLGCFLLLRDQGEG